MMIGLGFYFGKKACAFPSLYAEHNELAFFLLGGFAGREYFTEAGWKYRNLGGAIIVVAFIMLFLCRITGLDGF
jgi:hypothetical protein